MKRTYSGSSYRIGFPWSWVSKLFALVHLRPLLDPRDAVLEVVPEPFIIDRIIESTQLERERVRTGFGEHGCYEQGRWALRAIGSL
jgi:hypothetical protein